MTRPRRLLWPLIPALAIGLALWAARDEYAAVRVGRPLGKAWLTRRLGAFFYDWPSRFREERAYGFAQGADRVERDVRAWLTHRNGWDRTVTMTYHPPKGEPRYLTPYDGEGFDQDATGDEVILIRYAPPDDGVRLLVIVREGRFSFARWGRKVKGWVGL